jgi:N-acetylmuramoyl-L-alanine amidase
VFSPGTLLERSGDEIVVCGQLFHTGTPVVLWTDPGGYDAYRVEARFENPRLAAPQPTAGDVAGKARYGSWRKHLPAEEWDAVWREGWTLERLRRHVDLFVMHYDACGTSQQCFKVLHDRRGLSVHFMLDIDGTIYQTLDVKERAWHAGTANDRSVGVEIANIGAYGVAGTKDGSGVPENNLPKTLQDWYEPDGSGVRIRLPAELGDGGVRTAGFVGRPVRPLVVGRVHGRELAQFDLTNEQYAALIKLTAALTRVLPRITAECPRDAAGRPRWDVLSEQELTGFSGLIGHYHVTTDKVDPGPAFDWERLIAGVRLQSR